ncbi:MAG: precorrin-6A reductase [Phascolarctobacterium sp.]|nr:precorrin-6A reductase [Phascolarctobacterium sp.]
MKRVIWIIGGTSEGRSLIKDLAGLNIRILVSVATEYGAGMIPPQSNVYVKVSRMGLNEMCGFIKEHSPDCVIDATHPYATLVTETVKGACEKENCQYMRLLRPAGGAGDYTEVNNCAEAVELLNNVDGNIFLTTGSKNLPDFARVNRYDERIALRILPMESSLHLALQLGYNPSNIVCMQGPFSKDLNIAMFKKYRSQFIVTKNSGTTGGFKEKVDAALSVGAKLIVIGRSNEEQGSGYFEVLQYLLQKYKL